jgi:hypothetical protein
MSDGLWKQMYLAVKTSPQVHYSPSLLGSQPHPKPLCLSDHQFIMNSSAKLPMTSQ